MRVTAFGWALAFLFAVLPRTLSADDGWRPRGSKAFRLPIATASQQEAVERVPVRKSATHARRDKWSAVRTVQYEEEIPALQLPPQPEVPPESDVVPYFDRAQQQPSFDGAQQQPPADDAFSDPFGDGSGDGAPPAPQDLPAPGQFDDLQPPLSDDQFMPPQPFAPDEAVPELEQDLPPPDQYRFEPEEDEYDGVPEVNGLAQHERDCRKSVNELRNKKLSDIDLSIEATGRPGRDYPRPCELSNEAVPLSEAGSPYREPKDVVWTASGLCHKPLYFEQRNLERYGHATGPLTQPILSAAHFFSTIPVLPYRMGLRPPNECVYALGHYRPGNCAPYLVPAVPFTVRAGLSQAGAVVGSTYVLP